jgi:hypothetical protein
VARELLSGPKRKPRHKDVIAARVKKEMALVGKIERPVGVQPLNEGFFLLAAMRYRQVARAKNKYRTQPKGK